MSLETFGLTFNIYLFGIFMYTISILMILIMQNSEQDKVANSQLI